MEFAGTDAGFAITTIVQHGSPNAVERDKEENKSTKSTNGMSLSQSISPSCSISSGGESGRKSDSGGICLRRDPRAVHPGDIINPYFKFTQFLELWLCR
ncbi:hypothetical protein D9758_008411 [Tetrapyrgos nigripes]|uniref:Uncharacterized protein n=1 Tax=Tetrapyrgos nigripes TaxID=182062 RepID=A0A8H5GDZ9_9AGAR|nr:hypothetical protein D9758_008411 [Tetrapyrgos nigripes]